MMNVAGTVDAGSLNRALAYAQEYSSRTPELAVDSACYAVAARAYELTPAVTVGKIDSDLGTVITVKRGARGQPLSAKYSKNVMKRGGRMGDYVANVPLTVLIILAQAKAGSNYNLMTGHRWMRPEVPGTGLSREGFRAAMRGAENRLINARHSSTGFLRLGWVTVKRLLKSKFYGGPPPVDDEEAGTIDFGTTYAEQSGSSYSRTIENLVGNVPGAVGNNAPNYQRALIEKGSGPLQQAIEEVAAEKMEYVARKEHALLEERIAAIR